jgi:hypothetical protein
MNNARCSSLLRAVLFDFDRMATGFAHLPVSFRRVQVSNLDIG